MEPASFLFDFIVILAIWRFFLYYFIFHLLLMRSIDVSLYLVLLSEAQKLKIVLRKELPKLCIAVCMGCFAGAW